MVRLPRFAVFVGLPILLSLLFAGWQTQEAEVDDFAGILFEDGERPALELLQRSAKVTHTSGSAKVTHSSEALKSPTPVTKNSIDLGESQQAKDTVKHDSKTAGITTTAAVAVNSDFGISANGVGNLPIFLTGIVTDVVIVLICFVIFAVFSRRYPIVYMDSILKGFAPTSTIPDGFFGWAVASWNVTLDQAWDAAGLDHAMLLEFASMGFHTFKWIAFPMFFIMGPLNCAYGGNAAGQDHESWFSMGNVKFYSWLYWPISVFIWYVTWCVTSMCHNGMKKFMPLRFEWLRAMGDIRANTIMMVGIPEEYQSDKACKDFWDTVLPGAVESVNIAKDTTAAGNLKALVGQRDDAKYHMSLAETAWEKDGKDQDKRPTIKMSYFGQTADAIDTYKKQILELQPRIEDARNSIYKQCESLGQPNLSRGFITFKTRSDAEIALRLDLSDNVNAWVLDYPPQPVDVIWADMEQDPNAEASRALLGYALTAGMVIAYMPIVVFLCNVAEMINLGPLQPIWSSEAPSLGLTIMVDFMPTLLNLIFVNCFSLYGKAQSQYKLGVWYWWMNVFYVVMITALGTNFMSFVTVLANDPLKIFSMLADTMPLCTHYYMNYIGMQSYAHGMVLTRYVSLTKFKAHRRSHDEQEAKDMSEPEDQDYYGIGSRTARWSTMMCIGIVFGTLSPPCSMLTFMLFFIIRLVYGYMFCYAETRKSDLGGIFFVRCLQNTFISLHIYMVLMVGVFVQRASSWGPVLVVCLAWVYIGYSQKKFFEYKWERLPYTEVMSGNKTKRKIQEVKGSYVQPELCA